MKRSECKYIYLTHRVDQLESTVGDGVAEGVQPDPAWVAACRQAMRVHVGSLCCCWHLSPVVMFLQLIFATTPIINNTVAAQTVLLCLLYSSNFCIILSHCRNQLLAYTLCHIQGKNVVDDLPPLGTALPIVVTQPSPADCQGKGPLLLPSVGEWVKLRNVKAWVVAGQLQVLHHFSQTMRPALSHVHIYYVH